MSRPLRIHSPGLIYHVYARGNNKDLIFFEEKDYLRFLKNLERFRLEYKYELFAFCLMPNHFHLLIKVKEISISKIMQGLMTAYTMYINKKYKRVGHIFQGRFQSIVIEKDSYLLQVNRYIHLNPVKSGLVDKPIDYPWSSYGNFLHETQRHPLINIKEILTMLSDNETSQKEHFVDFTLAGIKNNFDPLKEQFRGILGGPKFTQKLTKVLKGIRP